MITQSDNRRLSVSDTPVKKTVNLSSLGSIPTELFKALLPVSDSMVDTLVSLLEDVSTLISTGAGDSEGILVRIKSTTASLKNARNKSTKRAAQSSSSHPDSYTIPSTERLGNPPIRRESDLRGDVRNLLGRSGHIKN